MTCRSVYEYAGLSIGVTAPEQPPLAWLDEFLSPAFATSPGPGGDVDASVELRLAPDEYQQMLELGPLDSSDELDCFSLDGHFESHPHWVSNHPTPFAHDQKRKLFYGFGPSRGHATILAQTDSAALRIGLLRVVREIATAHALRQGLIHVHSSAFAIDGRGVVVTGPKTAGKTSLLVNALRTGLADFVTNDRLFIRCDAGADFARGMGMPTIANVREGCLDMFPVLRERFRETRFDRDLSRAECLDASAAPIPHPDRWPRSLSPIQLCELIGAPAVPSAPLGTFVFPAISERVETFELERVSEEEAADAIYGGVFRSATPQAIPSAFRTPEGEKLPDEDSIRRSCGALASELDCYRCHLGPRAYSEPELAKELLRQLAGG